MNEYKFYAIYQFYKIKYLLSINFYTGEVPLDMDMVSLLSLIPLHPSLKLRRNRKSKSCDFRL